MASVKGFEVKAIKGFRGSEGEPLQQANLYCENKKVGFLRDNADGGAPVIQVEGEYEEKWKEAIAYFKEHLYDAKEVATGEELFYFLVTIKEWERIVRQQLKNGYSAIAFLEEIDQAYGYRTGGYKVFASHSDEELETIDEAVSNALDATAPIEWKKSLYHSVDDLNFQ